MKFVWGIIGACLLHCTIAANILALLPMPAKSHGILLERLLGELDKRGHQVTYLTSTPPLKPLGKVEVINIENTISILMKGIPGANFLNMRDASPWLSVLYRNTMAINVGEHILQQEQVQQIIKSSRKYDLILGEIFLDEGLLAGFSHKFQAPIVTMQPFMAGLWANYLVGNPAPAAVIPDPFLGYNNRMTFCERLENLLFGTFYSAIYTMYYLPMQDTLMRNYFGNDIPPISEIMKNTSLVLVNHHHSLAFPRSYVPNMVEVGGLHIFKPKPLPQDLQNMMDSSKNGVILFSMGSNIKSKDLPAETISGILKAFSRLKQDVLWKFEEELTDIPKNVKVMKWIPQSDILAHPKMKLFITHGGLLSTTEAVDRGVPVVGIPIFGDQPVNMKHTENAGLGKTLRYDDLNEENLYNVISEVINNPRYGEAAKLKSKVFHDNPMEPLERAVWWIEYVLRYQGAPHLRSSAQDLQWHQLHNLDVLALVFTVVAAALYINWLILKWIAKKLVGSNKQGKQKAKQSNKKKQ